MHLLRGARNGSTGRVCGLAVIIVGVPKEQFFSSTTQQLFHARGGAQVAAAGARARDSAVRKARRGAPGHSLTVGSRGDRVVY